MSLPPWLRQEGGDLILSLHVQPNAKRSEFAGLHGAAMKLRLAAPPVDGKANAALCTFLAECCGVSKSAVTVIGGETSRAKRVRVAGASPAAVARLLALA